MFDLVVVKNSFKEFFEIKNICKSKLEIPLLKNLMLEISNKKTKNIEDVKVNFFKSRAIDLKSENKTIKNMITFCDKIVNEKETIIIYLVNSKDKEQREIYDSWFLDLRC